MKSKEDTTENLVNISEKLGNTLCSPNVIQGEPEDTLDEPVNTFESKEQKEIDGLSKPLADISKPLALGNRNKTKKPKKTKQGHLVTRKRTIDESKLTPEKQWEIAKEYTDGILNVSQLAEKYNTSPENIGLIASRCWKNFTNMRETRALMSFGSASSQHSLKVLHNTSLINQQFLDLLSVSGTEITLTDAESIYAWIYVHTGENQMALEQAGLNAGLLYSKSEPNKAKPNYEKACSLRGLYLRSLPNVASYIKELRERRFIDQDISKTRVQSELLDQLSQLKESGDPRNKTHILKTIELLGKTIGAFIERVEVTEIDPNKALDHLIDMAKTGAVRELHRNQAKLPEKTKESADRFVSHCGDKKKSVTTYVSPETNEEYRIEEWEIQE